MIAAIPLKPPPWIRADDPTFLLPIGKRLAAFDSEIIELRVRSVADAGFGKPLLGKLAPAVVAVFSLEVASISAGENFGSKPAMKSSPVRATISYR
jgi:hypothetical protein